MTRSIKVPIIKNSNKSKKQQANHRFRLVVKIEVHNGKEVLLDTSEITGDYDVCDWKFIAH